MIPPTTGNIVALTIQAGVLVLAGAPLPRLLGVRSPRARLAYWRVLLVTCLLLPAVQPWLPARPEAAAASSVATEDVGVTAAAGPATASPPATRLVLPAVDLADLLVAGMAVRLAWFAVGLLWLSRLRRHARLLQPRPRSVDEAASLAGADAEFRQAAGRTRPVTFGVLRPVVVVPGDFTQFDLDEQRAIACHELFHVRRRDWLRTLADELVRAAAWFHPAAWWLTREIRLAREQVVDHEVVKRLGSRKPYLGALLRLASPDRGSSLVPAPLFLGRAHLSDRISLLLKEARMSRPRLVLSFLAMAAVLASSGSVVVAAFPLHAGSVLQKPRATVGAKQPGQMTARSAALDGAAKAPRRLRDVRPAFPAGAPDTPLILSMKIDTGGRVGDVTPVAGPADMADVAAQAVRQWTFAPGAAANTVLVGFNPSAATELRDQPPVLVGGNVRPPVKIKDVKPVYPAEAQDSRAQGFVILEARLASDGTVAEAQVVRSIPMLDEAALTAVLQWKFAPPGFPVQMTITVNFTLDGGPKKSGGFAGAGVPGGVGGGVAGGVPGGIKGGVEGGIVGGMPGGPVRVGGNVKAPQKVYDVKPVYPPDAKDAGVQGVVILEAMIGPDGKIKDAKILRSIPQLDAAALDAVKQWEFTPTFIDGQAVSVIMTVTVNFTLQ